MQYDIFGRFLFKNLLIDQKSRINYNLINFFIFFKKEDKIVIDHLIN